MEVIAEFRDRIRVTSEALDRHREQSRKTGTESPGYHRLLREHRQQQQILKLIDKSYPA